jgi:hypothetical protein
MASGDIAGGRRYTGGKGARAGPGPTVLAHPSLPNTSSFALVPLEL